MFTNRRSPQSEDIEAGDRIGSERLLEKHGEDNQEIEKWAGSLAKILDDVPYYMCTPGHPGKISRIPENLREIDLKSYEPYFLSVGPYHHDKPVVKLMERRKWRVLKYILEVKPELTLKDYLYELKKIEPEARSFYSEVDMDSQKFVLMLLLDSVFVLALFCGVPEIDEVMNQTNGVTGAVDNSEKLQMITAGDEQDEVGNEQDTTPRMFASSFTHDLFLLENQLPFFVLQKMHILIYGGSKTQLIHIMKAAIGIILLDYSKLDPECLVSPGEEAHHLLHICHMFFRPMLQQGSTSCQVPEVNQMFRLGSAVQLYESGVRFVVRSDSRQHSLLDIAFSNSGELVMPCLSVDDNTNSLLRNLIALEQMKYPNLGLNVSAYAVLLLHLITTPEDAKLLRRKGLIQHHLASDKEMMYLVNKLSVGLSFDYAEDDYSLKPVFLELKRYTERRVPRWRAWLKQRYFNNPWTTISLVAASILLLLTVVQTFFTVYSYYVPCVDCHL